MSKNEKQDTMQDDPFMRTDDLPDGYVLKLFGRDRKGSPAGRVVIKEKGAILHTMDNVVQPFPVTNDAVEHACAMYRLNVTDVNGNRHALRGMHAAAAAKFQHSLETARGYGRQGATEAEIRRAFRYYIQMGQQVSSTGAKLPREEAERMTKEELIAALARLGQLK